MHGHDKYFPIINKYEYLKSPSIVFEAYKYGRDIYFHVQSVSIMGEILKFKIKKRLDKLNNKEK